jgi:TonB dependent receptor/Carboxypeptidase regulatory-like domain
MRWKLVALVGAALLHTTLLVAQTGQTSVLAGTARSTSGTPLGGVTVTAESDRLIGGTRTTVTDGSGRYRFPALPPGTYTVTLTMGGFKRSQGRASLRLGEASRLDATLEVGDAAETSSPARMAVETPHAVSEHLTSAFLASTPIAARFGPGAMLLAPGINPDNYSAYGSVGASANAYRLDDLNSADPGSGRAWVLPALNWLEDVQVIGLGAGAQYGGATGATSVSLLRSGGSTFHGLAETFFRNDALTNSNVSDDLLALNPDLAPGHTDLVSDSSFQIGGPLKRDAVWFFAGAHFYYAGQTPGGYPAAPPQGIPVAGAGTSSPSESSPRVVFKPTIKLSDASQLSGFLHAERDVVQARNASLHVGPEATLNERSTTLAWNGHYTRVLSSTTVLDASYSGFHGTDDLIPYNGNTPGWYDVAGDYFAVNSSYFSNAGRTRHQAQAALTKAMTAFAGPHDVTLGVELERGSAKTETGYPGGRSIDSAGGVPFFLYLWEGSVTDSVTDRYTAYAQDAWHAGSRMTLNAGARFDRISASNAHLNDRAYATNAIAPRLGFAWDMRGNGRTVLRAHYGWFYEGARSNYIDAIDPSISAVYGVDIDRRQNFLGTPSILQPGTNHIVASDLKPPRLKEAVVGLEHELFGGLVAGVYGIDRRNDQFVDDVLQYKAADFVRTTVKDVGPDGFASSGDETAVTTSVYNQLGSALQNVFVISNPPGAFRTYRGLEVTIRRRVTARWGMQGSWVLSKVTGNDDNDGAGVDYDGPNTDAALQPLREGRVANDTTHLAKVFGTYRLPLGVLASGAFYYTSGATFTRSQGIRLNQGRVDLFIEPRGSQRYDSVMRLDARLERQFPIGGGRRIGVTAEGFNLLNDDTVTSRVTQSGLRYFSPRSLVAARQFRVGGVCRF